MFQEGKRDKLGRRQMQDWPLDGASRKLFQLLRQGQFPWRGQNKSPKTVSLRETSRRIGDSKRNTNFARSFAPKRDKERGDRLRRGVNSGFCGMREIMHVCVWMGMIRETG